MRELCSTSYFLLPVGEGIWGFGGFSVWGKLLGVKERDGNFVVPLD